MIIKRTHTVITAFFLSICFIHCVNASDNPRERDRKDKTPVLQDTRKINMSDEETAAELKDDEAAKLAHMKRAKKKVNKEINDPYNR